MRLCLLTLCLLSCGLAAPPTPADAAAEDAGLDAGVDAGKDAFCASTFGDQLTQAFGRVDGTVVAVVPPADAKCALPNDDHAVVQVSFDGGVYRMVINVRSSFGDPNIRMRTLSMALPQPAFAEGWHPGLTLDYVAQLGLHSDAGWDSVDMASAVQRIDALIDVGSDISVYTTSSGGAYAASAHLIHRNGKGNDGALVLRPTSANPTWVLFHFANQSF